MVHAATIFLSSFLLFLVQPLIARLILPWFGGSAAVWTTCMLFFQVLLLAGYAYAHLLNKNGKKTQAVVHTVLLAAAVALLPAWYARAHPGRNPYRLFAMSNLASLVALVGYPFVVEPLFTGREQVVG